jgi:secondary thiamine-phosphate synthase enzyme
VVQSGAGRELDWAAALARATFLRVKVHQTELEVETRGRGATDVTDRVAEVVRASGVTTGLATVFVVHTSASLVIQENADPAVLRDLGRWMSEVASESSRWEHDAEGPDDMPAHLRAVLMRTSESIPVTSGRLALGTWQAIYLWEHRTRRHVRRLVVHVAGI